MKKHTRIISILLLMCIALSSLPVFTSFADGDNSDIRYTQKIVAVVYDNSGSMIAGSNNIREPAARYSLEMLMSLLDVKDKMFIMPMNDGRTGYNSNSLDCGVEVKLDSNDRDKELDRVLADPRLDVYSTRCSTPPQAMEFAIEYLKNEGLKKESSLDSDNSDKEFWMVILTDGIFSSLNNYNTQTQKIEHFIKDYPSLNTVYASFGQGAEDLTNNNDLKSYKFTPYHASESSNLASVIQKISNQMSSRYTLKKNENYQVDGNKVILNLETIPFSLSSISIIAQNCGATVASVDYNGASITPSKPCVITPHQMLNMDNGFSCEIKGDPYFSGGTVTFTFTDKVNADYVSIFAEPALRISYYFEAMVNGNWQTVDVQYINDNLAKNDVIRVGYKVFEQANGNEVDLQKVFGDVVTDVFYINKHYQSGDNIPLVTGINDITISVSVMDGAYTLRDTETIIVEEVPGAYRVEVSGDAEFPVNSTETTAIFTVFVNNAPATADILKNYSYTVTANSPGGYNTNVKATMGSDGRITARLKVDQNNFDVYSITLEVTSPQKITKSKTHEVTLVPSSLDLEINGNDSLAITQYQLESNTDGFTFVLTTNGLPFPFNNSFSKYKLLVDNIDLTDKVSVSGNTLTFVPTYDALGAIADNPGDKEVVLLLESTSRPNLNKSYTVNLTVIKTVYTVQFHTTNKNIDRFDLANTDANICFSIFRDGVSISGEELKEAYESGKIEIKPHKHFGLFTLPWAIQSELTEVDNTPAVRVKVLKDMPRYFEWHYSAFIKGGNKEVTVNYRDAVGTDNFTVIPSDTWQHVLRISLLVIAHILLLYIITYIIGFFIVKPLPSGMVFKITDMGQNINTSTTPINDTIWKRYGWHILRFVMPWRVLSHQSISQLPALTGLTFSFDGEYIRVHPRSNGTIYQMNVKGGTATTVVETFTGMITTGTGSKPTLARAIEHNRARISSIKKIFDASDEITTLSEDNSLSSGSFIGKYGIGERRPPLEYVAGFVQTDFRNNGDD